MFCPECKIEYVAGVTSCVDCGAALVEQLQEESHDLDHEFVFLLETYNLSDIVLLESVLKGSGIEYQIMGDKLSVMRPMVGPAKFYVRDNQVEDAKRILNDVKLQYGAVSINDSDGINSDDESQD